ncbi:MAG: hypothetical protein PGN37_20405 [Mycobacterium kyogaense]|uniref:hypothetical protein n=1 Tax=Mycobacterium kyogaense TaxID=2212479 RepID=UPI002FF63AFF
MSFWADNLESIDAYGHEREERRAASAQMSEMDRAVGCRHGRMSRGDCPSCGHSIKGEL